MMKEIIVNALALWGLLAVVFMWAELLQIMVGAK